MNKRYVWLKLDEGFFDGKRIKKLRSIAGGDTYTVIYLKMLLSTINTGGVYRYEGIGDTLADELALEIQEDPENVRVTLEFLRRVGLLEDIEADAVELLEVKERTGSEAESTKRVRAYRERKALQGVTNSVTSALHDAKKETLEEEKEEEEDKEIERERKKAAKPQPSRHKYGAYNNVLLSDSEMEKIKSEFPSDYMNRIERLSEYIASTGKSYKSHLAALRSWARRDGEKQTERQNKYTNFNQRDYDFDDLERKLLEAQE